MNEMVSMCLHLKENVSLFFNLSPIVPLLDTTSLPQEFIQLLG